MFGGSKNGKRGGDAWAKIAKAQKQERIEKYNLAPATCKTCSNALPYEKRHYKYCSRSCSVTAKNKAKLKRECENCKTLICKYKRFCSRDCSKIVRAQERRQKFLDGKYVPQSTRQLGNHLREIRGNACEECGWNKIHPVTKRVPLQVHHVDGNYKNNLPYNLKLICPNCHSLTPTFGALNKGSGRTYRYKK